MQRFTIIFLALSAIAGLSQSAIDGPKQAKYFIKNSKGLDYKIDGKKEEHRFGLQLDDNKQFHHTKTAEDGVRLGCYGHELNGKQYSTNYVADGKGYRLVPKQGLITVYPKDGSAPRKASFDQSFTEEGEVNSGNVRYVFPEGCESPFIERADVEIPPIEKKDDVIALPDLCCDEKLPKILFPAAGSACMDYARLVIPIEMKILSQISTEALADVMKESNPAFMLRKLLKLIEKCVNHQS